MTNEEIKLLKNFITWQSLPFVDNSFTDEDEIIKKFDEWLKLNIGSDDRMTNEEALRMAYSKRKDSAGEERNFLNTIIQALEQQPCEECVSREDILKSFKEIKFYTNHKGMRVVQLVDVIDCVFDAPSVQPQPKMGHWIDADEGSERE